MEKRVGYIDSLKGLAILLVVMGHVIPHFYPDWRDVLYEDGNTAAMLLWMIIYSFHMPLFMFCSGLFALRIKEYTWKAVGNTLWKRACTLLLPFFVAGTIKYLTVGGFLDYWFLWQLFLFMVVVITIDGLCSLLPKYGQTVSTSIIMLSAIVVYKWWGKLMFMNTPPFLDIEHWNMYPYFCMGIICARYDLCTKWFSKNWVYTLALAIFGFLTYWVTICGHSLPLHGLTIGILPVSAIVLLVYLFKEGLCETSKPMQWLQNIGRHSLEIYILHVYFLFRLYPVGDFIIEQSKIDGGGSTTFMVQLLTSLAISVIIILLCYAVILVINKSQVLSQVLLGRKSEVK